MPASIPSPQKRVNKTAQQPLSVDRKADSIVRRIGLTCPETERFVLEERIQQLEAENASLRLQVRVLQELCLAD